VTDDELHAQLESLHMEIQHLRRQVSGVHRQVEARGGASWLKFVIKDLETNPHTQYRVHYYGVLYWLINFPAVILLFIFAPGLWLKAGILITLIYSIYANFATDYGSMSAAMAAFSRDPLPELPVTPHVEPNGGRQEPQ
jgi:hypothetical protein